jgi:DNA-binding NarL/FixJ family response regulator
VTRTPRPLRVLVADTSPLFRDTLRESLRNAADIEIVAIAGSADDAIRLAEQHQPTVAVVDVHLPGNGLHAIRRMHQKTPSVKVVALCGFIDAPSESELRALGVVEYVIKGVPNRRILAAIRRAAEEGVTL